MIISLATVGILDDTRLVVLEGRGIGLDDNRGWALLDGPNQLLSRIGCNLVGVLDVTGSSDRIAGSDLAIVASVRIGVRGAERVVQDVLVSSDVIATLLAIGIAVWDAGYLLLD